MRRRRTLFFRLVTTRVATEFETSQRWPRQARGEFRRRRRTASKTAHPFEKIHGREDPGEG
jgi:hypothetical protein